MFAVCGVTAYISILGSQNNPCLSNGTYYLSRADLVLKHVHSHLESEGGVISAFARLQPHNMGLYSGYRIN